MSSTHCFYLRKGKIFLREKLRHFSRGALKQLFCLFLELNSLCCRWSQQSGALVNHSRARAPSCVARLLAIAWASPSDIEPKSDVSGCSSSVERGSKTFSDSDLGITQRWCNQKFIRLGPWGSLPASWRERAFKSGAKVLNLYSITAHADGQTPRVWAKYLSSIETCRSSFESCKTSGEGSRKCHILSQPLSSATLVEDANSILVYPNLAGVMWVSRAWAVWVSMSICHLRSTRNEGHTTGI